MPPVMRQVYSSHVNSIGYDAQSQELHVTWDNGNTSIYSDVPASLADDVANSWSVGEALHKAIKGKHPHRYA